MCGFASQQPAFLTQAVAWELIMYSLELLNLLSREKKASQQPACTCLTDSISHGLLSPECQNTSVFVCERGTLHTRGHTWLPTWHFLGYT